MQRPPHRGVDHTSSAASPWYSSSGLVGFDSMPHQQQQHQRQSFQELLLSQTEGNESMLGLPSSGVPRLSGGHANYGSSSSMSQPPQQQVRSIYHSSQQQSVAHFQENSQNRNLGLEEQILSPVQLAYLESALQHNSNQAQQATSEPETEMNPSIPQMSRDRIVRENAGRSMQSRQNQRKSRLPLSAQMLAMQALANERNIDLSDPSSANVMTQLFPQVQSRMRAQHQANESNTAALSLPVSTPTQVASLQFSRQGYSHPNSRGNLSNTNIKNTISGPDVLQMNTWQLNHSSPLSGASTVDGGPASSQGDVALQDMAMVISDHVPEFSSGKKGQNYHNGPLFDFPDFSRNHETSGSSFKVNNNCLSLGYDIKDLIHGEGMDAYTKKRNDSLRKIDEILSLNLERKRMNPDLVLKLKIEEKKLRLRDLQARVREEVEKQQKDIMAMPQRPYRRFVRLCELQRDNLRSQIQAREKVIKEKHLKAVFQAHKKFLEAQKTMRDVRTARKLGVKKFHEKMQRNFLKRKNSERMEALKNNDMEKYREMLLEQQNNMLGDAAERYEVLSSFLNQTEDYIYKLGDKITAAKNQQEVDEAAANAQAQGRSEEEVRAAAACAREEVNLRNRFSEINAPEDSSSINKYYNLAHAVNERVVMQPSMLRGGTLREYQLVGLQWMLSLYNNKLNGILADEMGLGKTVQVMALIAYLMEFKGNYGPHVIIVPNAVLVNWKNELQNWLPSISCVFYVGNKDERKTLYDQEIKAEKFNILVTTYEFIMLDHSKLSKVDWKYIIIDEAQRMKDRESVLAREFDKYHCQRRLLLTGTPLQNDLKELWSLLNLLLPEVFDNRKAFHDWFSQPFQKEGRPSTHDDADDDQWLETEKKVIIIHRLHQILEPFMLRRRVEDVEGSLPPKVSVVLRCRMSAFQSAIYDWIKSTGTTRVDPKDEERRVQANSSYQPKVYKPQKNRCMELRKTCNHPLLNYPYFNDHSKEFLVRSCGKLWVLDRILVKLQRTGHRVLLFSTMTKLLDILEEYLIWRCLTYRRIDGKTSLEDRESAILDFNRPDSNCFIFLLSIRAAGRGLNLQTADTVVIYDPDANPQNEEQAVARAHRIGQKKEVKVIYLEAVADNFASHQREDDFVSKGVGGSKDDLPGNDRYMGTIESLIRNKIQQFKIDMADEVINAGRFDQRTTHEERRLTLEAMLHDDYRYQETLHDVPSLKEVNRMIARSEEEVNIFDQMDEEFNWVKDMVRYDEVPKWLRASTREVNSTIAKMSNKPSKSNLTDAMVLPGKRRGKKAPVYCKLDEEFEDDENNPALVNKDQPEEEADSSGSSQDGHTVKKITSSSVSSRKFQSLSALISRPSSLLSKKRCDEPDSNEGEDDLALQSRKKQRHSIRQILRHTAEMPEEKRSKKVADSVTFSGTNKMSEIIQRKCKRVISKLLNKLKAEGPRIVPLLTDFWKKIESSSYRDVKFNKFINFQKIDQRLERLEYNGVIELISDVQFMLKSSMKHFGYSREVRSEARKVHDLFFDNLKMAFRDTDFGEARKSVSFSGQVSTSNSAPSSKQTISPGQTKRQVINEKVESETTPPQKLPSCASLANTEKPRGSRSHMIRKESRVEIRISSQDQSQQEDQRSLTHPGELVISRKKRNDRERSGQGWVKAATWLRTDSRKRKARHQ